MIKKLIFATGNRGKLKEVREILSDIEIIGLQDLDDVPEIIEDAFTFEENSLIKVHTIYKKYKLPVIGDDSGLQVVQLNNEPGVFSARYAGENCSYEDNNRKIIKDLENFESPHKARFVCAASFYDGSNQITTEGYLDGEIIKEFRGQNGFGYDPIFIPEDYNITLATMPAEEKNKISHRAKAFKSLIGLMNKMDLI